MSQRHPGSRRRPQPADHDPDDVFVARTLELSNWARSNQQAIVVLGVLVVLAVAGVVYYRNYRQTLALQAAQALEAIHQTVALQDREGAVQQLGTFLERFDDTPYGGEARTLLGELYLETDRAQQAITVLDPVARSPRRPLELQAAALLATAYEQEERWPDAEATYLRVADRSDLDFQVRNALAAAARIRAAREDPAGAVELYERILADLDENDPARGLYEMRAEEIRQRM